MTASPASSTKRVTFEKFWLASVMGTNALVFTIIALTS